MRDRLTVLAFRAAWFAMPRLPESAVGRFADLVADLAWVRNGHGVQRLQANLGRVTGLALDAPELRALTRAGMRSYARYWREMFALGGWTLEEMAGRAELRGLEHIHAALGSGRGALLTATHSGNWDLAGVLISAAFGGGTTVAERLQPESLFQAFVQAREKYGIRILPHKGGLRPALAELTERAEAGELLALVSDRDLSRRGVEVRFFGATARMAAGPATLALATGIPIIPVAIWNEGGLVMVEAHEPLPILDGDTVATVTQRLADVYAGFIAAHPEDWHMLQRVWIDGGRA